eukprot:418491-Rhodomonas_salina.1
MRVARVPEQRVDLGSGPRVRVGAARRLRHPPRKDHDVLDSGPQTLMPYPTRCSTSLLNECLCVEPYVAEVRSAAAAAAASDKGTAKGEEKEDGEDGEETEEEEKEEEEEEGCHVIILATAIDLERVKQERTPL